MIVEYSIVMQSTAKTIKDYIASLEPDRRDAIQRIHDVIVKNLDSKIEAGMTYGMIGYYVPHSIYPAGYHCDPKMPLPVAGLASQKGHMSLYLMSLYMSPSELQWFTAAWAKTGKKLNMGKSCIRFKTLDAIPLEVVAQAASRFVVKDIINMYENARKQNDVAREERKQQAATTSATKSKPTSKVTKKAGKKLIAKPAAKTSKKRVAAKK